MNEENIEAKQPRQRRLTKEQLAPGLILSLALSFLLGLYAPLELYFTNIKEFQFDFWALFPQLLGIFGILLVICLVGFGLCGLIHRRLYDLALLVGGMGYVISYVHGMFLVGNLPPLDGTDFSWSDYNTETVISLIACAVIAAVFLLLARLLHMKKMRKVITGISLFFTAILMVTVVTVGITNDGFQKKPLMAVTKNAEFQMSSDQNMVIFLMDAVDSKAFRQLMDGDDPEYAETLSDFTYYPNTVGAYSFTEHSIPYILTGQWFENKEPHRDIPLPEIRLHLGHRQRAIVEQTGRQCCITAGLVKHLVEVLQPSCTAAGNHRDGYRIHHGLGHLQVKARLGTVCIHGGQQDLPCPQFLAPLCPFHHIQASKRASASNHNLPGAVAPAFSVDGQYHALATELLRRPGNQLRIFHRRRVHRNLIRARPKYLLKIRNRANAAADGQRDKHLFPGVLNDIHHGLPGIAGGGDVQKHHLVRALVGIVFRQLHGISGIPDIHKVDTLNHSAVLDVQAWNDSLCQHYFAS